MRGEGSRVTGRPQFFRDFNVGAWKRTAGGGCWRGYARLHRAAALRVQRVDSLEFVGQLFGQSLDLGDYDLRLPELLVAAGLEEVLAICLDVFNRDGHD